MPPFRHRAAKIKGFGSKPNEAANDNVIGVIIIAVAALEAISVKIIVIKYIRANKKGCGILLKKVFSSGKCHIKESLEFVFKHEEIHSAVIGTINKTHLAENVNLVSKIL